MNRTLTEAQKQRKLKMIASMVEYGIFHDYVGFITDMLVPDRIGTICHMDGRRFQINEDGSLTERI